MNDDMSSKLQQLKDMLGDDQMKDKLKSMMSIMPNIQNTEESSGNQQSDSSFGLSGNDAMISKFMKIMERRNQVNDPRVNLLNAIKPYLNKKRQGKVENYSKIFNFTQLASLLKDDDL